MAAVIRLPGESGVLLRLICILILSWLASACAGASIPPTPTATASPTATPLPTATAIPTASLTPEPTLDLALDRVAREEMLAATVTAFMDSGETEAALQSCQQAIQADPQLALAYALRGIILLNVVGDFQGSAADLDQAIHLGLASDVNKEFVPGYAAKTLYFFRGEANMMRGAYQQGIEDLEKFLEISEPLEYPELRAEAQNFLDEWQLEREPVTSGQKHEAEFFTILAPGGEGWLRDPTRPERIKFGRNDQLPNGEGAYGERTTIAVASSEELEQDFSNEEFLNFSCDYMTRVQPNRFRPLIQRCDWWTGLPFDCVRAETRTEDYGPAELPLSPPLILDGATLACRHPDINDILVILHFSQRGPQDSLDADLQTQADSFFAGLSFNQPED